MVFAVFHNGSLLQYVAARDSKEAIGLATEGKKLPGVVTAVKQRTPPLDEMSKDSLCRYLDLQLHVEVDWGRLNKSDLLIIASSVFDLKVRLSEAQS